MLIETTKHSLHAEALPAGAVHYLLRVFANPVGELDPATGQPWADYVATCIVTAGDDHAEVHGAIAVPTDARPLLREFGRLIGVRTMSWERWNAETRTKRRVAFTCAPELPALNSAPAAPASPTCDPLPPLCLGSVPSV